MEKLPDYHASTARSADEFERWATYGGGSASGEEIPLKTCPRCRQRIDIAEIECPLCGAKGV